MTEKNDLIKNRIDWIDLAKGITILLVIVGHTVGSPLRGIIFSFHMPLFFILSSVTFRYSADKGQFAANTRKAFKHLIVPAYVMYALVTCIFALQNMSLFTSAEVVKAFVSDRLLSAFFASGVEVAMASKVISPMGIPWFLIVLFLGRTLFDYLQLKISGKCLIVCSVILSVVGVWLGSVQWLPLSFDIVLAIQPLFYVGMHLYAFRVENKPAFKLVLSGAIWAGVLIISYVFAYHYMELACRRYTLYPLCYVGAVAGTMAVAELSVVVCSMKKVVAPLLYLGKYSLYMLCIHILDSSLFYKFWNLSGNSYVNAFLRIAIDSLIFAIFIFMAVKKHKNK